MAKNPKSLPENYSFSSLRIHKKCLNAFGIVVWLCDYNNRISLHKMDKNNFQKLENYKKTSELSSLRMYKLDREGPVDNIPSTDKIQHFVQTKI